MRVAYIASAVGMVVLALALMAAMHEAHYRQRRHRLLDARLQGVDARLGAVEAILSEDRLT